MYVMSVFWTKQYNISLINFYFNWSTYIYMDIINIYNAYNLHVNLNLVVAIAKLLVT